YTGINPSTRQQLETRSFDETGNWLSDTTTSPALNQTRAHNKANELTNLTGPSGVIDPVYDPVGNMTTMPKPGAWTTAFTCKWDAWNRLVEVKQGSTQVSLNDYDALHRRTRK